MKLRHAAALALIGWYLLVPPIVFDHGRVNVDAPISKWDHYQSFDSAEDCESTNLYLHEKARKVPQNKRVSPTTLAESIAEQYTNAECIEADDPRLK